MLWLAVEVAQFRCLSAVLHFNPQPISDNSPPVNDKWQSVEWASGEVMHVGLLVGQVAVDGTGPHFQ